LCQCGFARNGDSANGGIFWTDYTELENPLRGFTQIVGHTQVQEIQKIETNGGTIWFCDCLWKECYLTI
jgi:hypothetical protein